MYLAESEAAASQSAIFRRVMQTVDKSMRYVCPVSAMDRG